MKNKVKKLNLCYISIRTVGFEVSKNEKAEK